MSPIMLPSHGEVECGWERAINNHVLVAHSKGKIDMHTGKWKLGIVTSTNPTGWVQEHEYEYVEPDSNTYWQSINNVETSIMIEGTRYYFDDSHLADLYPHFCNGRTYNMTDAGAAGLAWTIKLMGWTEKDLARQGSVPRPNHTMLWRQRTNHLDPVEFRGYVRACGPEVLLEMWRIDAATLLETTIRQGVRPGPFLYDHPGPIYIDKEDGEYVVRERQNRLFHVSPETIAQWVDAADDSIRSGIITTYTPGTP